jgi:hypothetical protein
MALLTQNKVELCKNLIIALVLEKNAYFFENCDHNIDPCKASMYNTLHM